MTLPEAGPQESACNRQDRTWNPAHGIVFGGNLSQRDSIGRDGGSSGDPRKVRSTPAVPTSNSQRQHECQVDSKSCTKASSISAAARPNEARSIQTQRTKDSIFSTSAPSDASIVAAQALSSPRGDSRSSTDEYVLSSGSSECSTSGPEGSLRDSLRRLAISNDDDRPTEPRVDFASALGSTGYLEELDDVETRRRICSYQIPEDLWQQATLASTDSRVAHWRFDLYRNIEGEKPILHYCRRKDAAERIAQLFMNEKVVGYDIEWKPSALPFEGIKRNVSLIQLATPERIALFHVALFNGSAVEDCVPPSFKLIMEDPKITKVGVAIKADCTRLRKYLEVDSRGIFELSHLHKLVKHSATDSRNINKRLVSLTAQVEEHLRLPLWKGDEVRSSDWSKPLSRAQIEYAASDSYAAIHLFGILEAKRKELRPMPPCPAHAELNLPIRLADGASISTAGEVDEPTEDPSS